MGIARTPQTTTLPLKVKVRQGGKREEARAATSTLPGAAAAVDDVDSTATTTTTTAIRPPFVYCWDPSVEKYNNYFTLMVDMRYVSQVPHTRAWLCLNQALFDEHFKISITSQLVRMNGRSSSGVPDGEGGRGGAPFEPFAGAHFQGDCKSKMMQLLYGDVVKAIEQMLDV